jgi:hypothetical protein
VSESIYHTVESDLRFLESGLVDLEGYLLSKELYWPVGVSAPGGSPPYPRLTLGNLLLSRRRLSARSLGPGQQTELDRLNRRLEETRSRWRNAWEQKAQREFQVRLNLWRDFLNEYRESPSGNADRFRYEVTRRVLLELLEPEAGSVPQAEREMLSGLDGLLRVVFTSGGFIWEPELQAAFPVGTFWYLYGWLKEGE